MKCYRKGGGHGPKREGHDPPQKQGRYPTVLCVSWVGAASWCPPLPAQSCVAILSGLCIWTCRGGIF